MEIDKCIIRSNWIEAAQTIADKAMRCEFYEALMHYAMTGQKKDTPVELNLALGIVYSLIDIDRDKYEKKVEKRREAGKRGAMVTNEKRWGTPEESAEIDKSRQESANVDKSQQTSLNTNTNTNTSTITNKDKSLKYTPIPPKGEGGCVFDEYYKKVKGIRVPPEVEDTNYTSQYVWRLAEGCPAYGLSVQKAIETSPSKEHFEGCMQALHRKHKPVTDFARLKLALTMTRLNKQQESAALAEIRRSIDEPDIYKTMLEKVEYIVKGGNVSSLQGFFKSRR